MILWADYDDYASKTPNNLSVMHHSSLQVLPIYVMRNFIIRVIISVSGDNLSITSQPCHIKDVWEHKKRGL